MNRKYVFIFSILLFLTIVSGFFFNASLIDTSPLMTNDPNNILVGSLCERLENDVDITGSIVQFENKILSVKNYENDKKTGKFNCISSNLIEPYVISESFSCAEGDLALSRQQTWRIKNKCRSYTSTVVKCSQYNDEFTNDISRINYTKYKNGEDIYSFDSLISSIDNRKFGRDYIKSNSNILRGYVDIPSTMNNSLLMSAMICSIVNNGPVSKISSLCLRRPNRKECYGKFDHNFVNFPETYFPTHDGPWGKSNPGYSGLNNFPDDLDTSKWKYGAQSANISAASL